MADFDDYAALQATIASYARRASDTEFVARVPGFITQVEECVNHGAKGVGINPLRIREMEHTATVTLTDGEGDLPADYLGFRSWVAGSSPETQLAPIMPGASESIYPGNIGNWPRNFEIVGDVVRMVPNAGATSIGLRYYRAVPALSDSNTTNWLLEKSPQTYLYGALFFAAGFMQNDADATRNLAKFTSALRSLRQSDISARYARVIPKHRMRWP